VTFWNVRNMLLFWNITFHMILRHVGGGKVLPRKQHQQQLVEGDLCGDSQPPAQVLEHVAEEGREPYGCDGRVKLDVSEVRAVQVDERRVERVANLKAREVKACAAKGSLVGSGQVKGDGPILNQVTFGPLGDDFLEVNSFIPATFVPMGREVGKVNRHVWFISKEFDLSDFSDSLEVLGEDQEKALQKVKRRHKKKLGAGEAHPLGVPNFVYMAEVLHGGKGRGKKMTKSQSSEVSGGMEMVGGDKVESMSAAGNRSEGEARVNVMSSPPSGLHLILDDEGTQVPETPSLNHNVDLLKKLEANSLFGIQSGIRLSFTTPTVENTERLEVMEVVDVKNKVIRERNVGDQ